LNKQQCGKLRGGGGGCARKLTHAEVRGADGPYGAAAEAVSVPYATLAAAAARAPAARAVLSNDEVLHLKAVLFCNRPENASRNSAAKATTPKNSNQNTVKTKPITRCNIMNYLMK
jgi:hypothetical protein